MAVGLAAEIKERLGEEAILIDGDKGIFDVRADGKLYFSKYQQNRFPALGEVSAALKNETVCCG